VSRKHPIDEYVVNSLKCFGLLAVTVFLIAGYPCLCRADNKEGPSESTRNTAFNDPNEKPMIIWFHTIHRDSAKTLQTALSSGLITHVIVKAAHRKDFVLEKFRKQKVRIAQSVNIVKSFKVKAVWSRSIWPYYVNDDVHLSDYFDPNHYVNEIKILREEAETLGADYVAMDMEPYGYSPMKKLWRNRFSLSPEQEKLLIKAMDKVLDEAGKIEFIYPGGYKRKKHPANYFARLGRIRISGDMNANFPYEVYKAYVNTVRKTEDSKYTFLTVRDVFEKSEIWSNRKGLMIYPKEHNSNAVALELVRYARNLPVRETDNGSSKDSRR
jgi:hypothetical protein